MHIHPTTSYPKSKKYRCDTDSIIAQYENRLKIAPGYVALKNRFEEMTSSLIDSPCSVKVLSLLATCEIGGLNFISTKEQAQLLNQIPFSVFKLLVERVYDSFPGKLVRSVQLALIEMRRNARQYERMRLDLVAQYPVISIVSDVLQTDVINSLNEDIRNSANWGVTKRETIYWKRFAVSAWKKNHCLNYSFRNGDNLRERKPTFGKYAPIIQNATKRFLAELDCMGINITAQILGIQAFLIHGHVNPGEVYQNVDWHRDETAFGIPDYIMVLMLGDPKGDNGWTGGEFWCFKGEKQYPEEGFPIVKLVPEFNQAIILKNRDSYHYVEAIRANNLNRANRDILILDIYFNWENVSKGLLVDEGDSD